MHIEFWRYTMVALPGSLLKFLWYFARGYRYKILGLLCVAIFWAAYVSLSPYALKLLIDTVADTADNPTELLNVVWLPALFYVSLGFSNGMAFRFYDWLSLRVFPEMKSRITLEMFNYVEVHSYSYFQSNFAGTLANKINDMAKSATVVIANLIEYFFARFLCMVIGAITMFLVNPYFSMILVTWEVIFVCTSLYFAKKGHRYSEIFSESRSSVVGEMVDSFINILNVKLFAREGFESHHLKARLQESAEKDRSLLWYLLKVKIFYVISITILISSMTLLLVYERYHNRVTVGDFALILTLTTMLIEEVFFLANQLVGFLEDLGSCKQAMSIISTMHEAVDQPDATPLKVTKGEIVFNKVHFQYKGGHTVFADKSIVIHPGEKVGFVGFSGSGKSTFVHLILRFFDVDSGKILIDGVDIKKTTLASLRSQIALIPQDPVLFHRPLMENIRYGRLDATDEEVIECSKRAHCHEFIERLKDGYASSVGEGGVKISVGQRQRIAIARAMLKNAPILILDEATSSLDSVVENYIQESLALLMEGRTTLVIAHRLSTLFRMDRILVFSQGRVVEEGTHAALLSHNGHYAKLWNMQAGGFLGDKRGEAS